MKSEWNCGYWDLALCHSIIVSCAVVLNGFFALALSLSIYHVSGIEGRFHLHSEYTQGVYLSLILHTPTKMQTTDLLLLLTFNQLFFQCFMWPIYETEGSYILHYRIYHNFYSLQESMFTHECLLLSTKISIKNALFSAESCNNVTWNFNIQQ